MIVSVWHDDRYFLAVDKYLLYMLNMLFLATRFASSVFWLSVRDRWELVPCHW
jgi:hypothetical protein